MKQRSTHWFQNKNIRKFDIKTMLIHLIAQICAEVFEQCELPSYEGVVIHKFYRDNCPHCQRITPLIKEIDQRLEEAGFSSKVRSVECSKCDCSIAKIDAVPTIIVKKDDVEIGRFRGYRDYSEIAQLFSKFLKVDPSIFERSAADGPTEVVKLNENDFQKGFTGPWLILFYESKKDKRRELFVELNKFYQSKIHFGEIQASHAKTIAFRYAINNFPAILGIYNGVTVLYKGEIDLSSMIDWCDSFIAPTFSEIDKDKFEEIDKDLPPGDAVFIVFYRSLRLANSYFKHLSHQLRFRVQFYKTNDEQIMKKAGIHLKGDEKDDNVVATDSLALTVYRNGLFHKYEHDIDNNEELLAWIYNAHYPYLTRIKEKTFSGIFYGFKPVLLLITARDFLFSEFEKYSEIEHANMPYIGFLHAVINYDEFGSVIRKALPGFVVPGIIIYDPVYKKFYGEKMILTPENLAFVCRKLTSKYNDKKLPSYHEKSNKKQYFVVLCVLISLFVVVAGRRIKKTKIQ